jgi:hypothetical protein
MASIQSKLFLAQKEVARAARDQDLREVPKRASLDRAEEAQAQGTIKPTGGAEARGQENGYSFSEDELIDPTTKQMNRAQEQPA